MAIIYLAMFESMNAIGQRYESFIGVQPIRPPGQVDARSAITYAAYTTLTAMYPSQEAQFRAQRDAYHSLHLRPRFPTLVVAPRSADWPSAVSKALKALGVPLPTTLSTSRFSND